MNKNYNSSKQKLFIYGLYSKIISNEKHYTVLQSKYKTNATYWLLIIFAAIGVVFSSEEISLPLDSMIATTIICLVGIIGILFFWYEDIMILERFLNINFLEGTLMEKKYTWLPQVHHQHLVYTHKTMLKLKNLFFVGCIVILYIILNSTFFLYFYKKNMIIAIAGLIIGFIFFVFLIKYMFFKAYKNELSALKAIIHD